MTLSIQADKKDTKTTHTEEVLKENDSGKDKATYLKEQALRYQEKHPSMDNHPKSRQWLERGELKQETGGLLMAA